MMYSRATFNSSRFQPTSSTTTCKVINETKQISKKEKGLKLYKTILCESFEETGICSFGSRCNYAHGEDELRTVLYCEVTKPHTYRTRPCQTLVSTGFCPMNDSCRYRHDREYASKPKHFLKIRKMENPGSKTDVTVDNYRSLQDEAVDNSNPIGNILPLSSMQANMFEEDSCPLMSRGENDDSSFSRFETFFDRVADQEEKHSSSFLSPLQRLKIAQIMRKNSTVYTFKYTNIIFFKAVMIVQERRFIVEKNGDYVREITDDSEFIPSSQKVVTCHEIAFGPASNNANYENQGSALFFDLPQSEIQKYHVLGNMHKKLQKELALARNEHQRQSPGMVSEDLSCGSFQSFSMFYTDDHDMNELVDKIMEHKINDLLSGPSEAQQLQLEKLALFNRFSCLFKHWQKMSWPVDVETCTKKLRKCDEVPANRSKYTMKVKTSLSEDHDDGFESSVYLSKLYNRFILDMKHNNNREIVSGQSRLVAFEKSDTSALPRLKKESVNMLDRSRKTRCWTSLLHKNGSHNGWDMVELES